MLIADATPIVPPADRRARGKSLRERLPRGAHAECQRDVDRVDPLAILRAQERGRLPSLIPIRYGRLAASPLAFLRGAAAVMARDLATTATTGITLQICGDAHVGNFGGYASPERNLVFDLNDFDETIRGAWEWDVKRLTASLAVAGRERGLRDRQIQEIAFAGVRAYHDRLRTYASRGFLELWYERIDAAVLEGSFTDDAAIQQAMRKAERQTHLGLLPRIVEVDGDARRIVDEPPLTSHETRPLTGRLPELLRGYRASLPAERRLLLDRYQPVDLARKVVGVGSVGLRCFVLLLLGTDHDDPLFLQIKEAGPSVWEPHGRAARARQHGQRVVTGQRTMQAVSDLMLGWVRLGRKHYYLRQLRDMKLSLPIEQLDGADLANAARLCGWALARAHACSGDPATIAGYLGKSGAFDEAMVRFALAYADQTERDHATLVRAIQRGRVPALTGV